MIRCTIENVNILICDNYNKIKSVFSNKNIFVLKFILYYIILVVSSCNVDIHVMYILYKMTPLTLSQ